MWAPWGKAVGDRVHPLICHCLDTAAMAKRVLPLFLGPRLLAEVRAAFAPLGDADEWIAVLAGLHDIGKHTPMFQLLRETVAHERFKLWLPPEFGHLQVRGARNGRIDTPHGLLTALHINEALREWGADPSVAVRIACVLGGHHGYVPAAGMLRQVRREITGHGGKLWQEWRTELVAAVVAARGLPDPTSVNWAGVTLSPLAGTALAALTTLSDWIASDTNNFAYATTNNLTAYQQHVEHAADAAVARLRWTPWKPPRGFVDLFGKDPRPLQVTVGDLLRGRTEPALVVIEAPPGDGKSKAALYASALFITALGLSGVYIGNPTRAISNQLYLEVAELLKGQAQVSLVHADSRDFLDEQRVSPEAVCQDGAEGGDVAAAEWFTRKKALLAPVGVGTVDQALKTVIRSGHVFVRLASLSGKVVVIDEVHGYSTYMSTLLERVLEWLGAMGVPVILLSATLPSGKKDALVRAWRSGAGGNDKVDVQLEEGYPRVTVADTTTTKVVPTEAAEVNQSRTFRLKHLADDEVADWVVTEALLGRAVAVVHNLTRRVSVTHDAVVERLREVPEAQRPEIVVLTGTLAHKPRRDREEQLRQLLGPEGQRPVNGMIVLGTQVLELGLDLDFDALCTDLAPVDAMIQRAGRVQRHRNTAGTELTLAFTGVTDSPTGPRFPPHLHTVYPRLIMLRTWAQLRHLEPITLPSDIPELVDSVYGDDMTPPDGWEAEWARAEDQLELARARSRHAASLTYVPAPARLTDPHQLTHLNQNPSATRETTRRR
ncbi:CRISPR-associated endonuclease/helicase Cas3 [Actinokineospora diospyrosa]|uniref:CRISPR-associated endonuclease/helicase Cas3 n=1 Tax=Actinokineospora diospyrosa TaxID=103728 RepID=A0ABT1ICG7_9PSEU|nr:CRISPR-associated endonuclease/helicase Cas3 [Actinokineospora diospyrosa]